MKRDLNNDSTNYTINEITRKSIYYIGILAVLLTVTGFCVRLFHGGGKDPKVVILKEIGIVLILLMPALRLLIASVLLCFKKEFLYSILALAVILLSFAVVLSPFARY